MVRTVVIKDDHDTFQVDPLVKMLEIFVHRLLVGGVSQWYIELSIIHDPAHHRDIVPLPLRHPDTQLGIAREPNSTLFVPHVRRYKYQGQIKNVC